MPTHNTFSYSKFAEDLRGALLSAKSQGHIDDTHGLHLMDNGSELCIFWTCSGMTLASWIGYAGDQAAQTKLLNLVSLVKESPAITVNTFNDFMINGAVLPATHTTLIDFAKPIYDMIAGGAEQGCQGEFHFVGCDLLDPASHIETVLITNRESLAA